MATSLTYNIDCMEYMKTLPDKAFDLAVVDPPYGDGLQERERERETGTASTDTSTRPSALLREKPLLLRGGQEDTARGRTSGNQTGPGVTRTGGTWAEKYAKKSYRGTSRRGRNTLKNFSASHAIRSSGGGNYFALPPTRCFLIWRKLTISESFSMAMAEYAWTSFNENAKVFEYAPQGRPGDDRFHPTQKPVALYKWLLSKYAKPGDKILDTHLGSGSSRIAAWDLGFDFVGCEIDKVYFDLEEKRFEEHTKQQRFDLT